MKYDFYGNGSLCAPKADLFGRVKNVRDMYGILSGVWCEYTCAPRLREKWSEDNKTVGQCSITAFLVREYFGGRVFAIPTESGAHCYNEVGGEVFDLTSEQFNGKPLVYDLKNEQFPEIQFKSEEKRARFEFLKREFEKNLENSERITQELLSMQDKKYRDFQSALIPTVEKEQMIGVRTPDLKKFAAILKKRDGDEAERFLRTLPHKFFDEDQLHAFILNGEKDFDKCVKNVERFLPYINNWATCDQLSPKVFAKNEEKLLIFAERWFSSGATYTVRFAIGVYMHYFLGERFDEDLAKKVASIKEGDYYVDMMAAWYFATALAKNYESVIGFFENGSLGAFIHNAAIKKACESFRVTDEHKKYLKTLKKGKMREERLAAREVRRSRSEE